MIRRVWAIVTREPQISVREVAKRMGYKSSSSAQAALVILRQAGYIISEPKKTGRTIIVPFYDERIG